MSSYPPPPPSPSLRRRFSSSFLPTPGSSLTLKDASTDQIYLSPSVYTPRSSHFVEVPIVQPTRPGGDSDRARVLQVPLTPSRRVIGGSTRFGPGASELEVTLDGDQGGEVKESPGWRAKLRIWFIYRGESCSSVRDRACPDEEPRRSQGLNGFRPEFGLRFS